ncbi:hypothetical protein COK01_24805 [Priestia megaterium]|uniref:hypothetical protein n=1 Tax=Priestia megaterium TaxID=1404 RepID=UPI000BF26FFB|nr:hypothetical protein [Priestia megaterium]PFP45271.1 hypothetical protein COK01_24805 [Priestia megaterium]
MLSIGISKEHIDLLKKEKLKSDIELEKYFDLDSKVRDDTKFELVPVSKIKGLNRHRGEAGYTWLDHVEKKAGGLDKRKFESIQQKLDNTSLEEFKEWFSSDSFPMKQDKLTLFYYADYDEYYVGNGNHRTSWAKLVDAEYIKANVITYRYNPIKYTNFQKVKRLEENFFQLLNICNLHYNLRQDLVEYKGWSVVIHKPLIITSNTTQIQITNYILKLNKDMDFIVKLMNKYFLFLRLPKKLRMKLLNFFNHCSKDNYRTYKILKMLQQRDWSPNCDSIEWKDIKQMKYIT